MKTQLIIIVVISGLVSSCATLKKSNQIDYSLQNLDNKYKELEGDYRVYSTDTTYRTLEFSLFYKGQYNYNNFPDSNVRINLKVIDKRRLKVTLYDGNEILNQKIRRGKIKDSYFQINRSIRIYPFWIILNGLGIHKTRVGLLTNGNLLVDTANDGIALLVIFPFFGKGDQHYGLEFEKIN